MKRAMNAMTVVAAVLLAGSAAAGGSYDHTAWTYGGTHGPENWGELRPEYAACNGDQQSPINIRPTTTLESELGAIRFNWKESELQVQNNGYTIQALYDKGSYVKVNGAKYYLSQYHFHVPSEHAIDGMLYDMEAHFVHRARNGEMTVIAVFFEEGEENPILKPIWEHFPPVGKISHPADIKIKAGELLPSNPNKYFFYRGSLTTPPCSEIVNWYVLAEPIEASKAQISAFADVIERNNRPVQPLNRRFVLAHE